MSYMLCPTCGEANGVVNTTIFQCRCARERAAQHLKREQEPAPHERPNELYHLICDTMEAEAVRLNENTWSVSLAGAIHDAVQSHLAAQPPQGELQELKLSSEGGRSGLSHPVALPSPPSPAKFGQPREQEGREGLQKVDLWRRIAKEMRHEHDTGDGHFSTEEVELVEGFVAAAQPPQELVSLREALTTSVMAHLPIYDEYGDICDCRGCDWRKAYSYEPNGKMESDAQWQIHIDSVIRAALTRGAVGGTK